MGANDKFQSIIQRKTQGSMSAQISWQNAMEQSRFCGMSVEVLESLVAFFSSPLTLKFLCKLLVEDSRYKSPDSFVTVWEQFRELNDDYSYDEEQLFKSLERVLIFALDENVKTKFCTVLGYLTCVEEFANSSNVPLQLCDAVSQMLEEFGFDG